MFLMPDCCDVTAREQAVQCSAAPKKRTEKDSGSAQYRILVRCKQARDGYAGRWAHGCGSVCEICSTILSRSRIHK